MTASNSSAKASARTSASRNSTGRSPAAARASATKSGDVSTPTTAIPRRASSSACRPGPQPASSTRIPGSSPSASTRKSTSCTVPFVNAFFGDRPVPRNSATGLNHGPVGHRRHVAHALQPARLQIVAGRRRTAPKPGTVVAAQLDAVGLRPGRATVARRGSTAAQSSRADPPAVPATTRARLAAVEHAVALAITARRTADSAGSSPRIARTASSASTCSSCSSGYLISSLLVVEYTRAGRIGLRSFWSDTVDVSSRVTVALLLLALYAAHRAGRELQVCAATRSSR